MLPPEQGSTKPPLLEGDKERAIANKAGASGHQENNGH
ncbi:hypothetical protein NOC27_1680 [Nitrosococcus oceani AFC27]|nr:hypothetical protein NOC27_1680 [Nitrosococcus oceani AFC27]